MDEPVTIGLDEVIALHSGPTSLYHSVGQIFCGKIQSGEWPPDQRDHAE